MSELIIDKDGYAVFPNTRADFRYDASTKQLVDVVYFPLKKKELYPMLEEVLLNYIEK
jgi:hypothetical protein